MGIFIKDDYSYTTRHDLCRSFSFIECVFIEVIQKGTFSFLFGCVYRPSTNFEFALFNFEMLSVLKIIDSEKNKIAFLGGYYNFDLLKYAEHAYISE